MNRKSILRNMGVAFASQGVGLCLSFVMGLLVPKVLGVEGYGYWQLFILYSSYAGLFQFGISDGVYLLNGGKHRDELDLPVLHSQFALMVGTQWVLGVSVVVASFAIDSGPERHFVLMATICYVLVSNISGYLGYIFQAVNETALYSLSVILDKVTFLVPLLLLVAFGNSDFRVYIVVYSISKIIAMVFCIYHGREVLLCRGVGFPRGIRALAESARVGIKLMIANLAGQLVIGIVRILVDSCFGIAEFSQISFSFSLVNFFLTFVSQASMVLFPALRRSKAHELRSFFENARQGMAIVLLGVYLLVFPMKGVFLAWLPKYAKSIEMLPLLLPICLFDGKADIVGATFYKVLRWEGRLLAVNVMTVTISAVMGLCGAYIFGSVRLTVISAVVAIVARSIVMERELAGHFELPWRSLAAEEISLTVVFLLSASLLGDVEAAFVYGVFYVAYLWRNGPFLSKLVALRG